MRWLSVSLATLSLILPLAATPQQAPTPSDVVTVACRALEIYTDENLKVTAIVFHQQDETQRSPLAALLRQHSGDMVEIQVGNGSWQRVRMERLKSCFGRGLLLVPSSTAIAEHAVFQLRVPASATR